MYPGWELLYNGSISSVVPDCGPVHLSNSFDYSINVRELLHC